jgi:hypothetical protein
MVLFLGVKDVQHLSSNRQRYSADKHMRSRFMELERLDSSHMYGISAFGPYFAVYVGDRDKKRVKPPQVRLRALGPQEIPGEWWRWDVRTAEGEQKLRSILRAIDAEKAETEM